MNRSLIIKQATIEYLDEIASLFNDYRVFYKQESDYEQAKAFLFDRFVHRESTIFLAIDSNNNKAVGFTQLYPSFSSVSLKRSWILNDLFVREEYRRCGVAQLLLEAAKSHAEQTQSKGLELSTAVTNAIGQRLYERNGYKKDEEFYHYYLSL